MPTIDTITQDLAELDSIAVVLATIEFHFGSTSATGDVWRRLIELRAKLLQLRTVPHRAV